MKRFTSAFSLSRRCADPWCYVAAIVLASGHLLHAVSVDGIALLSENFSINAQWSGRFQVQDDGPATLFTGGYTAASADGSPVSASTTSPFGSYIYANASIGTFDLQDSSWCGSGSGSGIFRGGEILTHAQGTWDFQTAGRSLNLNLAIDAEYSNYGTRFGGLRVTLTDRTLSSVLFDMVNPGTSFSYNGQNNYAFAVDPSHVYELAMSGYSDSFDRDSTSLNISATLAAVPEPSTCFILALGAGMLGLQCIRDARTRKAAF